MKQDLCAAALSACLVVTLLIQLSSEVPDLGSAASDYDKLYIYCQCLSNRKGMIAWIAQGLEKVVPQPDLKNKESIPAELPAEVRQSVEEVNYNTPVVSLESRQS